jgi:hypothetical protein
MLKITQEIYGGLELRNIFSDYDRRNQFSDEGFNKLFELLDIGEDLEIDVIAICCDFSEEPLAAVLKDYNLESFQELADNTLAIMVDDVTVIYQGY